MSGMSDLATSALTGAPVLMLVVKVTAVLVIGLVAAALARRRPAAVRHLILALTFGCLALVPITGWLAPASTVEVARRGPSGLAPIAAHAGQPDGAAAATEPGPAASPGTSRATPAGIAAEGGGRTPALVAAAPWLVWGAGAAFLLGTLALAFARLGRRIRATSSAWPEGADRLASLAARQGIDRLPVLLVDDGGEGPLTWGLRRPVIVLPADARGWSRAHLDRALLHELEHVRRADVAVHAAARMLCALYWFHPLVWVAWRRLRLDAERACDDTVLGDTDGVDYAEQLVTLAARSSRAGAPHLAMAARSDLAVRVRALLDGAQARGRAGHGAMALTVVGALLLSVGLGPVRLALASPPARPVARSQPAPAAGPPRSPERAALDRPLVDAAARGDVAAVAALLDRGADPDAAVKGEGSPLIVAARGGHQAVVVRLLDRGARVGLAVRGDGSPLIAAASHGNLAIVRLLLDRGAPIHQIVPDDENALIQASSAGKLEVVKLLVARGADVNGRAWAALTPRTGEWRTPLGQARAGRHGDVVDFLVASGAR